MREEIATPPRNSSLPFQVRLSGISYCDGSYVIRRTNSKITCIEFVIQGKGTVQENDKIFEAKAGDVYILHEGKNHYYYSDANDPWIKIWANVSGPATEHLLTAYGLDLVNHAEGLNLEEAFQKLYKTAAKCHTAEEVSDRCSILFHEILQGVANHLRKDDSGAQTAAKRIKELIDSRTEFDFTLNDIAEAMFFTKTHVIRLFRDAYEITPYEYILTRKLRIAKDLLINTTLSVSEIASRLNFCDAHYFTNFFRDRTGTNPREYRKRTHENISKQ